MKMAWTQLEEGGLRLLSVHPKARLLVLASTFSAGRRARPSCQTMAVPVPALNLESHHSRSRDQPSTWLALTPVVAAQCR